MLVLSAGEILTSKSTALAQNPPFSSTNTVPVRHVNAVAVQIQGYEAADALLNRLFSPRTCCKYCAARPVSCPILERDLETHGSVAPNIEIHR